MEAERIETETPAIILLPSGSCNTDAWTSRKLRQLSKAHQAARQEEVDEAEAIQLFKKRRNEEESTAVVEYLRLREDEIKDYKANRGIRIHQCYLATLQLLQSITVTPTEVIQGVPITIMSVSDLCQSAHPILHEGVPISKEDRESLCELDMQMELEILEEERYDIQPHDDEHTSSAKSIFQRSKRILDNQLSGLARRDSQTNQDYAYQS